MNMTDTDATDPRRAAIEEELRERLANDRGAARLTPELRLDPPGAGEAATPASRLGPTRVSEGVMPDRNAGPMALNAIGLICLACRGLSGGDAAFCTKCGARFNALVVATGNPNGKRGARA